MSTPRIRAMDKTKKRWAASQAKLDKTKQELNRKKSLLATTINTPGWKIIIEGLANSIETLKENLYKTSSLRVFKCMEIKSEIKAKRKLYSLLLNAEKTNQLARELGE